MTKLVFVFNEKDLKKFDVTKEELLKEVRVFANENGIIESSFGVFEKDSEDAMALCIKIASRILKGNQVYVACLKKLELDVDGEIEDCIVSHREWMKMRNV